jgi:hypothetical protein
VQIGPCEMCREALFSGFVCGSKECQFYSPDVLAEAERPLFWGYAENAAELQALRDAFELYPPRNDGAGRCGCLIERPNGVQISCSRAYMHEGWHAVYFGSMRWYKTDRPRRASAIWPRKE